MGRTARILVVDSNVFERELLSEACETIQWPVSITAACSAERALALLSAELDAGRCPDLMLLSTFLNGSSSIAFLERVRSQAALAGMPVIVQGTTPTEDGLRCGFLAHGVLRVVQKAADFHGLISVALHLRLLLTGQDEETPAAVEEAHHSISG